MEVDRVAAGSLEVVVAGNLEVVVGSPGVADNPEEVAAALECNIPLQITIIIILLEEGVAMVP